VPTWVLHDFGGPWGLTWAADHPDRFASVTLVNCGVLRMYRDYQDPAVQLAVLRLYRATEPDLGSERLHHRLRSLVRPALVVWGARDPYLPVRCAQRQRETFPGAEVVLLADSGHWPMVDHPVAVEQPVLKFLSTMSPR
jgi:pimeloyl-ACP methyl ester carboxylesterase